MFKLKMKNYFPSISKHLTVFLSYPNDLNLSLRKMHHPTGHGISPRHADFLAEAVPPAKLWNSRPVSKS